MSTEPVIRHISIRPSAAEPDRAPRPHKVPRVTDQDHRFIESFLLNGCRDAAAAMQIAGFKGFDRPNRVIALQRRLQHVIDTEIVRLKRTETMDEEEALTLVAQLSRTADDERVRLGALRTVLETQGLLSNRGSAADGKEARKGLEAIINAVKRKLDRSGKSSRVRVRQAIQVDVEPDEDAAGPTQKLLENPVDKGQD